jgi:hypothetical protein
MLMSVSSPVGRALVARPTAIKGAAATMDKAGGKIKYGAKTKIPYRATK